MKLLLTMFCYPSSLTTALSEAHTPAVYKIICYAKIPWRAEGKQKPKIIFQTWSSLNKHCFFYVMYYLNESFVSGYKKQCEFVSGTTESNI